jgi:hypothetical protein
MDSWPLADASLRSVATGHYEMTVWQSFLVRLSMFRWVPRQYYVGCCRHARSLTVVCYHRALPRHSAVRTFSWLQDEAMLESSASVRRGPRSPRSRTSLGRGRFRTLYCSSSNLQYRAAADCSGRTLSDWRSRFTSVLLVPEENGAKLCYFPLNHCLDGQPRCVNQLPGTDAAGLSTARNVSVTRVPFNTTPTGVLCRSPT